MRVARLAVAVLVLGLFGTCVEEGRKMAPTIQEARAMHVDSLMALPGVVSVGIGRNDAGNPAIVIGVDRERQAGDAELPTSLEGYPVVVQVIGEIRAR